MPIRTFNRPSFLSRTLFVVAAAVAVSAGCGPTSPPPGSPGGSSARGVNAETTVKPGKIVKTDEQWMKELTPEQYHVMREKGTERAFTGKYWDTKTQGVYTCAACGEVLFISDTKFDSGCGWPSFFKPADGSAIEEHEDSTLGMTRTEVTCAKCGAHLGHVFDDGPNPTGLRYCINSVSIDLKPADPAATAASDPATPAPAGTAKPK